MKKQISTLLFILVFTLTYGQNGEKNFLDQNYIEVNGYARKEVTPNRIYLKIVINKKEFKDQSLDQIEQSMFKKLEEIGVNLSQQIVAKDFVSNFKNYLILKSDILLIKEYQLLVYEAKSAEKVFVELEKLGISNVSIEKLDHSEIENYKKEVKILAIKAAKEKSDALTTAIGQTTGRALYIQENSNNIDGLLPGQTPGVSNKGYSTYKYSDYKKEIYLDFEKIIIEYNVLVRFELK